VTVTTNTASLQDVINANSSIVDVLYANPKGSVVRDAVLRQPTQFVSPEFTNWRDEQRAWRETVALYDQSYHMTTTTVRGKDALAFFTGTGVNGFSTFKQDKARHYVCCSPSGHVIGDGILYWTNPEEIALVGRAAGHNWLEYQAAIGSWDIELERDEIFSKNPAGRREVYRYQVEGPNAAALLERLNGAPLPESRTFDIITLTIAGRRVLALRHTMAGGAGSSIGKGGMITKILAAKRAAGSGASTVIAWGREPEVLIRLAAGESIGTHLDARTPKLAARKQWMADHLQMRGSVTVDEGAVIKLRDEGKSLLPIGVVEVTGEFARGDVIAVRSPTGSEIARGLANYSAAEARLIARKPSSQIEGLLGYANEPELIHRDNLVLA
jgi:hypothetical protein